MGNGSKQNPWRRKCEERERASADKESFSQRTPEVLGKQGSRVRVGGDVKRGVTL